ncbi:MAG: HAMP domain-containing histidine kinase [Lachnospiraceae bacterium]|nr:HAMP domain-containing histidine kinase [Lachnospiraceae bacterium]
MDNSKMAVSHYLAQMENEIRIPVTTIIGNVEQISRENADPVLHDDVVSIRKAADSLIALTDDLIDIVKISNDELVIADEDYDFEDIILDIRHAVESQAALKGIESEINIEENIPCRFFGDKKRVLKMLRRLVKHAVTVTDKGTVKFGASCMPGAFGNMFLRFDVADCGSGELDEDVAMTLAGKSVKESVSAAATSVFIIKYIAGRMGGKFTARAKTGEGCTFTLLISQKPVGMATFKDRMDESEIGDNDEQHFIVRKKLRMLVIGEDRHVAVEGQRAIYRYKIGSDFTDNAEEALMLLSRIEYDAICVGENMTIDDGTSLVDAIRGLGEKYPEKAEYFENLPIVLVESIYGHKAADIRSKVTGRFPIPFHTHVLEELLVKMFPGDRLYNIDHSFEVEGLDSLKALGLNSDEAFERFGSDEQGYRKAVLAVCRSSDTKGKMLNYYLDQSDYKNYIIVLRSMLDVTQLIGSEELSKDAKELEKAAKYNPGPEMAEKTAEFAQKYENIMASVRSVMSDSYDETNKGAIDREDLIFLIDELRGYLSNYQIKEVEELFFTLAQFSYEDNRVMELIHEAEEHMLSYNYNETMTTLDKIMTRIQR